MAHNSRHNVDKASVRCATTRPRKEFFPRLLTTKLYRRHNVARLSVACLFCRGKVSAIGRRANADIPRCFAKALPGSPPGSFQQTGREVLKLTPQIRERFLVCGMPVRPQHLSRQIVPTLIFFGAESGRWRRRQPTTAHSLSGNNHNRLGRLCYFCPGFRTTRPLVP